MSETTEFIYEQDVMTEIEKQPEKELLLALLECVGALACIDYSLEERIEVAKKAEALIESRIGPVHWVTMACEDGCEICEARES